MAKKELLFQRISIFLCLQQFNSISNYFEILSLNIEIILGPLTTENPHHPSLSFNL